MKAFKKLSLSRSPFAEGDQDIDGYYFKLNESLTAAETNELLKYVKENAEYAFMQNYSFGTTNLQTMHNNNNADIVKTMFLLTTLKTGTGTPVFTLGKEFGVSKIKYMGNVDNLAVGEKKEDKKEKEVAPPPAPVNESLDNKEEGKEVAEEPIKEETPVVEEPAIKEEKAKTKPTGDKATAPKKGGGRKKAENKK
jgi:hypothetical protein